MRLYVMPLQPISARGKIRWKFESAHRVQKKIKKCGQKTRYYRRMLYFYNNLTDLVSFVTYIYMKINEKTVYSRSCNC